MGVKSQFIKKVQSQFINGYKKAKIYIKLNYPNWAAVTITLKLHLFKTKQHCGGKKAKQQRCPHKPTQAHSTGKWKPTVFLMFLLTAWHNSMTYTDTVNYTWIIKLALMLEPLASVCAAAICQSSLLGFSGLLTYGAESPNRASWAEGWLTLTWLCSVPTNHQWQSLHSCI